MPRVTHLSALVVLGALLALTAVGCADDRDDGEPAGSEEAPEEAAEGTTEATGDDTADDLDDGDDAGADGTDDDTHADEEEAGVEEAPEPVLRLVVADAEEPVVRVLDLVEETVEAEFDVDAAGATLEADPAGRVVAVAQPDADVVHFVDTGSFAVDHGDHAHSYVTEPRLLDPALEIYQPGHTLGAAGAISVFADGDGTAHLLDVDALVDNELDTRDADTGGSHHGSVAPVGDGLLATSGPAEGQDHGLADEVWVHDDGERIGAHECGDLHGVTADAGWAAFPCDDGVLVLEEADGEATERRIEYPEELGDGRLWYLRTDPGSGLVAATEGSMLVIADVASGEAEAVELPAEATERSAIDADGNVLVLDVDGALHQIDLATGDLVATSADTVTVDEDGPRATIVGGRDRVYVPVTSEGVVHEFATNDDLRLARTIEVDGAPGTLAWAGAVPR